MPYLPIAATILRRLYEEPPAEPARRRRRHPEPAPSERERHRWSASPAALARALKPRGRATDTG